MQSLTTVKSTQAQNPANTEKSTPASLSHPAEQAHDYLPSLQ